MIRQIIIPFLIVVSGFFCLEYGLPVAIGEFLAGIIGEYLFGVSNQPWLEFLGHLGVLSLMFVAGFEIDLPTLKKNFWKATFIGSLSFFTPFLSVCLVGWYLGLELRGILLMGVALSTTSLAVVFPTLKNRGLLQHSQGQVMLAAAMVVDILSMLFLAFSVYDFQLEQVLYLSAVLTGIFFAERILIRIFDRYEGNRAEFELKFLLLLILSFGFLAEEGGVHAALICFLLGVMFSPIDPKHELIIEKLSSVVFSLLAPAFFFSAGTKIRLAELDLKDFSLLAALVPIAFVTKYVGTYFPLSKVCKEVAVFGSVIFNYRLSFGLIAAVYGLEQNAITRGQFSSITLTILLLSIIGAFIEKKKYGDFKLPSAPVKN